MKKRGNLFLLLTAAVLYLVWLYSGDDQPDSLSHKKMKSIEMEIEGKHLWPLYFLEGSIYKLMGESAEHIYSEFGQPVYRAPTPYGYQWWIYQFNDQYLQIGIENNKVVTIYATGPNISIDPISIGNDYNQVKSKFSLSSLLTYHGDRSQYDFYLSSEDIKLRPLVQLSENHFLQLYFDQFTGELSSVRLLTGEVLIRHRPYQISYFGKLPSLPALSEEEWNMIEDARERQIFDITNVIRKRHHLEELDWDAEVSRVAFLHSKDMAENRYFSHFTLTGEGLKQRLQRYNIAYLTAGENIAAQYQDAPAVIEGWMNSEGHRKAILNPNYTHLGVGVYQDYYTQNFLQKTVLLP